MVARVLRVCKVSSMKDTARDTLALALGTLIVCAVIVGAITFTLSFAGLDDYGRIVAGEGHLSFLVPLGVDGLTLVGVAATYILRTAPWHVRLYAWAVFAVALGASIAGNLSHAMAHHLSRQGEVGAAAWPVFLALASHVVIVVRRRQEMARVVADEQIDESSVNATAEDAETPAARGPLPAKTYAIAQARRGWNVGRIHAALAARGDDVSRRTVTRWIADLRTTPAVLDDEPTPAT